MKKIFYIFALSLTLGIASAGTAHAQIKTGFEFITNIVDGVQTVIGKVQDKVNNVITVTRQKITARKDQFKDLSKYDSLKSRAKKAKEVSEQAGSVAKKEELADAKRLAELTAEKKDTEDKYTEEMQDAENSYNEKVKIADTNISNLNTMMQNDPSSAADIEKDMEAAQTERTRLDNDYEGYKKSTEAAKDQELGPIEGEIKTLTAKQAKRAEEEALAKAADALKEKASEVSAKEVAETAFLKEGEPKTAEAVHNLRRLRAKTAYNEVTEGYAKVIKIKKDRKESDDVAEDYVKAVSDQQTVIDKLQVYTAITVENIKALSEYLELVITELKVTATSELAKSTAYDMNNASKDMTRLNLCDYEYVPTGK